MTDVQSRLEAALRNRLSIEMIELLVLSTIDVLEEDNTTINRSTVLLLLEKEKQRRNDEQIEANLVDDCIAEVERHLTFYLNAAIVQTIEDQGTFELPEAWSCTAFSEAVLNDLGVILMNSHANGDEKIYGSITFIGDIAKHLNDAGIFSSDLKASFSIEEGAEGLTISSPMSILDINPQVRIYPKQRLQSGSLVNLLDHLSNNPDMLITQHILEYSQLYNH